MPIELIGPHRLRVGSVFDRNIDDLTRGETPWGMYTDPPWGQQMTEFFESLRAQHVGKETPLRTYQEVLRRVGQLAKVRVPGPLFLESGLRWSEEWRELMVSEGMTYVAALDMRYGGGKTKMHLLTFWPSPRVPAAFLQVVRDPGYRALLAQTKGGPVSIRSVLSPFATPNAIVVDPCCGRGLVAKGVVSLKMRFFGNEFDPVRAADTRQILMRLATGLMRSA